MCYVIMYLVSDSCIHTYPQLLILCVCLLTFFYNTLFAFESLTYTMFCSWLEFHRVSISYCPPRWKVNMLTTALWEAVCITCVASDFSNAIHHIFRNRTHLHMILYVCNTSILIYLGVPLFCRFINLRFHVNILNYCVFIASLYLLHSA